MPAQDLDLQRALAASMSTEKQKKAQAGYESTRCHLIEVGDALMQYSITCPALPDTTMVGNQGNPACNPACKTKRKQYLVTYYSGTCKHWDGLNIRNSNLKA